MAGNGVLPKTAPMPKSCRTTYPAWLNDPDPSPGEGVVQRTLCVVNGANTCQWQKVGQLIYIIHCIMYVMHCIMYIIHYTLYIIVLFVSSITVNKTML